MYNPLSINPPNSPYRNDVHSIHSMEWTNIERLRGAGIYILKKTFHSVYRYNFRLLQNWNSQLTPYVAFN